MIPVFDMILACPNCPAKFKLPEGINPVGRTFKCSSCEHQWVLAEEPKDSAPITSLESDSYEPAVSLGALLGKTNDSESEIDEPAFKDSLKNNSKPTILAFYQKKSYQILNCLVCVLAIIFCLASYFISHADKLWQKNPSVLEYMQDIGLAPSNLLKFELVDCTISDIQAAKDSEKQIEVEVKVIINNTGSDPAKLHNIRFSVYNKDQNFIGDLQMQMDKLIAPGASETIEGRLNRVPKDTMFVAIDIGGSLDLLLRNRKVIAKI